MSMLSPSSRRDAALAALLFAGTAMYWTALPHSLGPADESVHLYEAKRVLEGEVLYRDVFNFITPGWFYLMASLYRLFGTSIDTARGAMAVMHGLTTVLVYFSSRRLGIGRGIAWMPALGYVVICQSAWPIVSQHWVSTLLCAALLCACAGRTPGYARTVLAIGIVAGLLICVQQQRGVFMAAGVVVWLLGDALLRWRYGSPPPTATVLREIAVFAGGIALVIVPVLGAAMARAGVYAVWYALVIFPLFNYGQAMHCPWGDVNLMTIVNARFTFPLVLKYLPLPLLISAGRLLWLAQQRRELLVAQRLLLLLIFCGASALSIAYFPDFIKISFIAFAFLVAAAEVLQWMARTLPLSPRWSWGLGATTSAALLIGSAYHLSNNRTLLRSDFPYSVSTAFGRIDYPKAEEPQLHDLLAELLAGARTGELYAYPMMSDLYLTVPAHNPTPYGFFLAFGYHSPQEVQRVVDILVAKQLPYIVLIPALLRSDDPILRFVAAGYEPVTPKPLAGRVIYRRKTGA
jgi:hypothetical protein